MKYSKLLWTVPCLALLVSCGADDDDNGQTTTVPVHAFNHYTELTTGSYAGFGKAVYQFTLKFPASTLQIYTESMSLPGGSQTNFTTSPMAVRPSGMSLDGTYREVIPFATDAPMQKGTVSGLKGVLTQSAWLPGVVAGFPLTVPSMSSHYAVMQYDLNDRFHVKTFWNDITLAGTTVTTFPGMSGPYENNSVTYRIIMDLENPAECKADLIIYNAKFAPQMPALNPILLKGLPVVFTDAGYKIKGVDIVPKLEQDNTMQDNPKFTFNSFVIECSGPEMNSFVIRYKVASVYEGSFAGQWFKPVSK